MHSPVALIAMMVALQLSKPPAATEPAKAADKPGAGVPARSMTMSTAPAADAPAATAPATAPRSPATVTRRAAVDIRLLLVRSDWSKGKNVEKLESELTSLLEGVPLSEDFRANLSASAAKILFPDTFVAVYRPGELKSLLAWLTEHELLRVAEHATPITDESASATPSPNDGSSQGRDGSTASQYRIFVTEKNLSLSLGQVGFPRSSPVPPFVTRVCGWEWQFSSRLRKGTGPGESTIEIETTRALVVREKLEISPGGTTEERRPFPPGILSFKFPADRVAVVHCLHGLTPFGNPRAFGNSDWDPILVIDRAKEKGPVGISPGLAKPDSFAKTTTRKAKPKPKEIPSPRIPFARSSKSSATTQPASEPRTAVVFQLKRTKASDIAKLLGQLMKDGRFSADQNSNSLVAVVTQEELAPVKALVAQLEVPSASGYSSKPPQPVQIPLQPGDVQDPSDPKSVVETTRQQYAALEREAKVLAQRVREKAGTKAADELRRELKTTVTQSFALRQQLQGAELKLLRQRIKKVEAALSRRQALREQIIDQRVKALLSQAAAVPLGTTEPGRAAHPFASPGH